MKDKKAKLMKEPCYDGFACWNGAKTPAEYQEKGNDVVYEHPVGAGAMRQFYEGASKQTVAAMEAESW